MRDLRLESSSSELAVYGAIALDRGGLQRCRAGFSGSSLALSLSLRRRACRPRLACVDDGTGAFRKGWGFVCVNIVRACNLRYFAVHEKGTWHRPSRTSVGPAFAAVCIAPCPLRDGLLLAVEAPIKGHVSCDGNLCAVKELSVENREIYGAGMQVGRR